MCGPKTHEDTWSKRITSQRVVLKHTGIHGDKRITGQRVVLNTRGYMETNVSLVNV